MTTLNIRYNGQDTCYCMPECLPKIPDKLDCDFFPCYEAEDGETTGCFNDNICYCNTDTVATMYLISCYEFCASKGLGTMGCRYHSNYRQDYCDCAGSYIPVTQDLDVTATTGESCAKLALIECPAGTKGELLADQNQEVEGDQIFVSESCVFQCRPIVECPSGTKPHITLDEFTCEAYDSLCNDNGDGTISCGHLMWTFIDSDQDLTQSEANGFAAFTSSPDTYWTDVYYDDWRLPTTVELNSLRRQDSVIPTNCGVEIPVSAMFHLSCNNMWSSETVIGEKDIGGGLSVTTILGVYLDLVDGTVYQENDIPEAARAILVRDI